MRPELVIPLILESALSNQVQISTELSAIIFSRIAHERPYDAWKVLDKNDELKQRILDLTHFMIKYYMKQAAISMNKVSDTSREFYSDIMATIPDNVILEGDVILDEEFLRPVEDLIQSLNDMQLLNAKFCRTVLCRVVEYSKPLQVFDQLRVERYINRSFHEEEVVFGTYDYLLRHVINEAISTRVSKDDYEDVAELLRMPITDEI